MSGRCGKMICRLLVPAGPALLLLAAAPCAHAAVFTTLYSFGPEAFEGDDPNSGVIMDSAGNLYGETSGGGTAFLGSIYKLTPSGVLTTLYSFGGAAPSQQTGNFPSGGLSLDAAGSLYGTTSYGGPHGRGVAFKITSSLQEVVFHGFTDHDGYPSGGGVLDSQGNFILATGGGQKDDGGLLLEFSPSGLETLLYQFSDKSTGISPRLCTYCVGYGASDSKLSGGLGSWRNFSG